MKREKNSGLPEHQACVSLANITQSQNLRPSLIATPMLEFQVQSPSNKFNQTAKIIPSWKNVETPVRPRDASMCWLDEETEVNESHRWFQNKG